MNRKRNLWIFIGVVVLMAALVSGFVLMQTSAQDLLVQTLETAQTITDGHAVVALNVDTPEQAASGTVEIWARQGVDGSDGAHPLGAFRLEVLETSAAQAQGAVIVSDGATLWAYSPAENKVFVGTPAEAQTLMAENEMLAGKFGQFSEGHPANPADSQYAAPQNAEEAVAKLLEYFNASKSGSETLAGETASQLKLEPIPEQMPAEYLAVGGLLNLWIGQASHLPLAISYTGGSLGEFSATVLELEVNAGVDEARFTFEIPDGAEIVTFADLQPQSLTLEQAAASSEFAFLTPAATPPGATLVDILDVRGATVQRYTLPEGGSFSVAQGLLSENAAEARTPSSESQPVEVRGTSGNMLVSADGAQVLLTWTEGDLFYSIAGDLTPEQALSIAESLQ